MTYKMSTRRKLAIATWAAPREGNIYGKMTVDVEDAIRYIEHLRQISGEKVTITHLVGKVAAMALQSSPDLNGRIVFGRYIPHKTVDITFLAAVDGGNDLAKVKVNDTDKKSLVEIAKDLQAGANKLRKGKDESYEKTKSTLRLLPTWLLRPLVWSIGYLSGAVGLSIPAMGVDAFPFGSCIITSVGMLGLDEAYAPPTPFARVPVYLVVTAIKERPAVYEGKIAIRRQLDVLATIDHRFMDGYQGALLAKKMRVALEAPWTLDGLDKAPWQQEG